jgi:peptidoglycan/LPS O-acetylase OafA/YrhL
MSIAPPPLPRPSARDPGIDLLRGLCIVLVVLHHTGLRIGLKHSVLAPLLPKWFLDAFIWNGLEAVFIFFVISGFLIASNTIARWGSLAGIDRRAFYRRRAARILPALLILVAVLAALDLAGLEDWVIAPATQSLPRAILAALGLHVNWYEARTGYLPASWDVLWSLSIEELFYLAFPLACLLPGRTRLLVPALALLALSMPFVRAAAQGNEIWYEKATLPGMSAIATGVLAALLVARWPAMPRRTAGLALALGIVGIGSVLFFERELWRSLGEGTMLLLAGCAAATLVGLRWRRAAGVTGARAAGRWLRSFGRLSYEVYLTHMFVVWPVVYAWRASGIGDAWGFLFYLPALAGSWALGALVARLVSGPCERLLLRRWAERRAGPSTLRALSP